MKTHRASGSIALLVLAAGCGRPAEEPVAPSSKALVAGPTCVTANPANCMMAKSNEAPPAVPMNYVLTECTYEVILENVVVGDGQGVSESKLEVAVASKADGASVRWPASGYQEMEKDYDKDPDQLVATYVLAKGEKRTISLCATVTEVDNGGLNGDSDVGSDCTTVNLVCNRAALTAPPQRVPLSADLCRGNKLDDHGVCKHYNGRATVSYEVTLSDRDFDGIPAEKDATPDPEDEACRGQEGHGVVLFSQYGQSNINDIIGQIGMGLDEMVQNYDFVAIAMSPTDVLGFTVREQTLARADMVVEPTLEGLMSALRGATKRGFDISLYVAGHGTALAGVDFFTSADVDGFIDELELRGEFAPQSSGTCAFPFRMVYGIPCYFSEANDLWIDSSAHATTGADTENLYPQDGNAFARHWNNGDSFGVALAASLNPAVHALNAAVLEVWGQAVCTAQGILGSPLMKSDCSLWFFTGGGGQSVNFGADYDATLSGLDNMNLGSRQLFRGNANITKGTALTW